jgi:uncharacterized protein YegP (UPF0339 family)
MVEYSKTTTEATDMAKITSLFSSKKAKNNTDGHEEFFKEDFPPVVNRTATQKEEKVEPKKVSAPKKPAKKKAESKNRVAPQQVERIINPKSTKAKSTAKKAEKPAAKVVKAEEAKKPAAKKAEPKKAEKPISKKAEPKKATAKKPATKKTEAKPKKAASKELYDDSPEIKGAVAVQQSREIASGKWEINRAKDGRFFFSLYASNHVIIAYSQIYSSLTAVTTGINSVISNASKAETEDTTLKKSASIPCPKWEIYLDKAEQYRFRLYAPNGLVVCHSSHGYATKGGCKGGIESIKRFASEEASVNKTYLK